jgi:hypothetical protein
VLKKKREHVATRPATLQGTRATRHRLYYKILKFLERAPDGRTDWTPKELSEELKANYSSVRRECRQLFKDNKAITIPKGKFTEYRATKRAQEDLSRLAAAYPTGGERYKFHGITLRLKAEKLGKATFEKKIVNTIPLGGVVRDRWAGVAGAGTRETSFQLSKSCLMVYCSCTNLPMDYDDFVMWLARVDGYLTAKGLPRIEGNLEHWDSRQFGFSNDYRLKEVNKLVKAVSLKGIWSWYAEVYEKKMPNGETVLRHGVHSTEEHTLAEIIGIANGDISRVQAEDLLRQTTQAQNNNTKFLQETVKAVGKVRADLAKGKTCGAAADDDTSFLLGRIEQKVDNLTASIENLAAEQRTANRINEKLVDAITKLATPAAKTPDSSEQQPQRRPPDNLGMVV